MKNPQGPKCETTHLTLECYLCLPDLQRMYNGDGQVMETKRTSTVQNGHLPDEMSVERALKVLNMLKIFHQTERTSTDKADAKRT